MGRLGPIKWLLDHGADPTFTDLDGTLPCTTANLYYQDEAFELLRDAYQEKVAAGSDDHEDDNI